MGLKNFFFGGALPSIIGIGDISSALGISSENALNISAFYQGVTTICNTIACLPFKVYQDKQVQKNNPVHYVLKEKANDYQTAFEFFNTMLLIMLIRGNSFAYISRNKAGEVESLSIIDYLSVEVIIFENKLYFRFDGNREKTFENSDLIHFKNIGSGFLGIDPVSNFKNNLEVSLNAISYTNKVYNGEASSVRGTITYDKQLNKEQRERLRGELSSNFSGKNGKRILFLEDGMKLDNINLDPSSTKFLESRTFEKSEIASMLNVPPFVVGDYSSSYSNVELQNLHLYKQTLLPIITKIEGELKHKLFTRGEIVEGLYVKCNIEGILRGDSKSRGEFYKELFYLGSISSEEIRDKEDMEAEIKGTAYIHSNLIPANISKEFWEAKVIKDTAKADLDKSNIGKDE